MADQDAGWCSAAANRTWAGRCRRSSPASRLLAIGLVTLTVANCAGPQASRRGNKYGVAASPRVVAEGEPVPKGGGRLLTGKPYVIADRTYVPHAGPGYDKEGWASWYGTAFHGRLTANGEIFDRESVAAAHPTLPLPSYVRVTNLGNGRSMIVRVNDRGPYEQGRLIDVSERVSDALDFRRKGVSRVRVQYVGKASLNGSDDAKLMATLRTDGQVAPFRPGGTPVMVADGARAGERRVAPTRLADARPVLGRLPEYAEDDEAPPRRTANAQAGRVAEPGPERAAPSRPAATADGRAGDLPIDIRPPVRPDFSGIY